MKKTEWKKWLFSLFFVAMSTVALQAQTLQEVVYLKNGSIIRGIIIEQVPNESLKIETADGSLFVFRMDEVSKITKESPKKATSLKSSSVSFSTDSEYGWQRAPRYRGFVGHHFVANTGDFNDTYGVSIFTSHGCQLIPELYVGLGIGFLGYFSGDDYDDSWALSIPVFVHLRRDLHTVLQKNAAPYVDVKVGYSFAEDDDYGSYYGNHHHYDSDDCILFKGLYFNPSVGYHFYFGESKVGIGVGLEYIMQRVELVSSTMHGFGLSMAIDF